jgi:DHA2 family multidrug resistance protein-like MFS transporter
MSQATVSTIPVIPTLSSRRRWLIMVTLVSSLIVVILDNTILNVALPSISRQLHASQAQLTGAILSYAVVFGSLQFSAGVLGDRWGRKRILMIGLVLFGLSSLAASRAGDPNQLIVLRAIMAIGAAMVTPQTLSILTNVFPPEERAKAIAIWAAFTGASLAIGPVVGGILLDHFWWGSIFFINVPIVIGAFIASWVLVPESKNPNPAALDPIGILMSIVGLGSLIFGLIYGGQERDWSSFYSTGLIIFGIAVLLGFVWYEAHTTHPAFDVRFFKNPRFSAASIATAMAFFALFGVTFFLTFYFQFVKGLTPLQAGLSVLPVGIAQIIFSPRVPRVVKRFGPKFTIAGGLTVLAISLGGYAFITLSDPVWHVYILGFLTGTGMAHVIAPSTESVMSSLPPENAGAGSAVNNTTRQVSGAFGIAIFGTILQLIYAREIQSSLNVLPAPVQDQASRSIGDTYVVVGQLAQTNPKAFSSAIATFGCDPGQACASGQAFLAGVHVTSVIAAVFAMLGAAVVLKYLPRRGMAVAYTRASVPGASVPPVAEDGVNGADALDGVDPLVDANEGLDDLLVPTPVDVAAAGAPRTTESD